MGAGALLLVLGALAADAGPAGAAGTPAAAPPAPLGCLARHYGIAPLQQGGRWLARLPDGALVPYDDGRNKSFAERLAAPDLEDIFSIPYATGPARPVEREDHDPGRVRVEALLAAVYGAPPRPRDLVTMSLLAARVRVHRLVAPALARVARRLERAAGEDPAIAPFLHQPGGGFVWRTIAGTDRRSGHAYGIAVDLDPRRCEYWRWRRGAGAPRWRNRVPQALVDAFEAEGFIWGGRWYHYDTMHFEYRPELLDPACAPPSAPAAR
jgi:hypothetical protein